MPRVSLEENKNDQTLYNRLKTERASFDSMFRDAGDYFSPTRYKFTLSRTNRGDRRNHRIINNVTLFAKNTLRSGMMAGITNPSRPWYVISLEDQELAEDEQVKLWLHEITVRMREVHRKSNLYKVLPNTYEELGVFGTSALFVEEDFEKVIHFVPMAIGSYMLANDDKGRISVMVRDIRRTVRQLIDEFGEHEGDPKKINWDNFSVKVKELWTTGKHDEYIDFRHVVKPNPEFNPSKSESRFKRFVSRYYETSSDDADKKVGFKRYLRVKGFDMFQVLAPRWKVTEGDVYATECPGFNALGPARELMALEKDRKQIVEKKARPPMVADPSLESKPTSILPGDITYTDERDGRKRFRNAYDVNFDIRELKEVIFELKQDINQAFHVDLFRMLDLLDKSGVTATEILERREEKLLALGPVLEQLNQDLLDPLIDLTFSFMLRQGLIPPLPQALRDRQGDDLKVEYVSVLAQAQKATTLTSLQRFADSVIDLSQRTNDASVLDKLDKDEYIDEVAETLLVSPRVVVSNEQAEDARAERDRQLALQAQLQALADASQTAKTLSEVDLKSDNALSRLANQSQKPQLAGV